MSSQEHAAARRDRQRYHDAGDSGTHVDAGAAQEADAAGREHAGREVLQALSVLLFLHREVLAIRDGTAASRSSSGLTLPYVYIRPLGAAPLARCP